MVCPPAWRSCANARGVTHQASLASYKTAKCNLRNQNAAKCNFALRSLVASRFTAKLPLLLELELLTNCILQFATGKQTVAIQREPPSQHASASYS